MRFLSIGGGNADRGRARRSSTSGSDDDTGAIAFAENDDATSYGLVDEIARRVLLSGGRVLAVRAAEVPHGGPVAAILRYAP